MVKFSYDRKYARKLSPLKHVICLDYNSYQAAHQFNERKVNAKGINLNSIFSLVALEFI